MTILRMAGALQVLHLRGVAWTRLLLLLLLLLLQPRK